MSGVPDVWFDGGNQTTGSYGNCNGCYQAYRSVYNGLMDAASGMSSVAIGGTFSISGTTANLSATFMQVDPVTLSNVRASFFLYEDHILYNGQYWDKMCRMIQYQPVTTLHNVGDQATVSVTMTLNSSWNVNNLHAMVVLENAANPKQVWQASRLPSSGIDYSLSVPERLASIPAGNGTATFAASLWNLGSASDQVAFAVDQAMGWPTDFQIAGDSNWYTSHTIAVPANGTVEVTIRVRTDGVKRIGSGSFTATSTNSGRVQPINLRVFNGSPAILFVDDDNGSSYNGVPYDQAFRDALTQLGYLYDWWDAKNNHANAGPNATAVAGFDAIIWQTAYQSGDLLRDGEIAALQGYVQDGGRLYLDSMDFLSTVTSPTEFTTSILGVDTWAVNTHAASEHGVGGDPISDGLNLPLTWPVTQANRTDTVNPTANAAAILFSDTNLPNALRNTVGTSGRVVFSTIPHNVFSTSAPDPNNQKIVMQRILGWLLQSDATSAPEPVARLSGMMGANPNPLHPQTELSFRISPSAAGAPVSLTLVDAAGRLVRNLVSGPVAAGTHHASWDGRDDAGHAAPAGIYFARLKSREGESTTKLVLVR